MKDLHDEAVQVKPLTLDATIPTRAHDHDAGFDLYASADMECPANTITKVPTGIALGIPVGQVGDVRPRSGLASKGITVANSPGTIDAGYAGEVLVLIHNQTGYDYQIKAGDRIAQLVVTYVNMQPMQIVESLGESQRGESGFGSTGN